MYIFMFGEPKLEKFKPWTKLVVFIFWEKNALQNEIMNNEIKNLYIEADIQLLFLYSIMWNRGKYEKTKITVGPLICQPPDSEIAEVFNIDLIMTLLMSLRSIINVYDTKSINF